MTAGGRHRHGFWHRHSLSIVTAGFLISWICLYGRSNPSTHAGAFFGNAVADWSGTFVMVFATKFLYEKGSAESRQLPKEDTLLSPVRELLLEHSLSIFLVLTGLAWLWLYLRMDAESKWGQVVGNILSEWTQILMLVIMTKRLIESHSKESHR